MKPSAVLVLLLALASGNHVKAADLHVAPEPLAGFYTESQTVSVEVPPGVQVQYRFLEDVDGGLLPWRSPLLLSALPGETRAYTLRLVSTLANGESLTKDFRYTIARSSPSRPTVKPAPGYTTHPVTVEAQLPEGMVTTLAGQPVTFPLTLEGNPGELRTYRLDVAGPRGVDDGATWIYAVDRRGQGAVGLEILSPLEGNWANIQWLVLSQQGLDSLAWCWGDTWNEAASVVYQAPVRLEASGATAVTVRGRAKGSGAAVERTVHWSQGKTTLTDWGIPESGVSTTALSFPSTPGTEVSWDEGRTWRTMSQDRTESLLEQSLKVVPMQFRKAGVSLPARALYWMDARTPVVPKVELWGGWNPLLTAAASTDSLLSVEWTLASGKNQPEEPVWGPSAAWKIPDGTVGATVSARAPNGRVVRSAPLSFPEVGWVRPEWTPWETGGGQVAPRAGFVAVYETRSDREVPEPTAASPSLAGPFLPSVPLGVDRTFFVRFAWKDASGVVGPSTAVIPVRVDHLAPLPPRVSFSKRLVKIEPTDGEPGARLFFATTNGKLGAADSPAWQPYQGVIDLDALPSGSVPQWIHALVVDSAGNPGTPRWNFPLGAGVAAYEWKGLTFQDPARGWSGALSDGAVLPAVRVLVQPSWDGDVSGVWSLTTSSSTLPSDWDKSMTQVDKPVAYVGALGERRTFFTWWNLRNSTGWIWDKPKMISFVLEQGMPAAPVVSGLEGPLVRANPWAVTANAGQSGDRLTYSVSLDGSNPPDPTGNRALDWPGTLSWDTPDGTRAEIRLRLAVTSASGQTREIAWAKSVVIDRTVPAGLLISGEPFRTFRTPATITLGPFPTRVRYTMSRDGSLPPVPTTESPVLAGASLEFPGIAGQQTLYRLRLRPFSDADQAGPVSDPLAILVDLTQASGTAARSPGLNDGLQVVGLPENGLSAKSLTLSITSPWGTPHFELSEGAVPAKPIEATSPPVSGSLVLSGSEGADRTYTLAVRSFSEEGDPLTPEARWTLRIDRSAPEKPELNVELDSRRPEATLNWGKTSLASDERLFYRWSWSTFPSGTGQLDWTLADGTVPRFSAPDGRLTTLTAEAQVRDAAGNAGEIHTETVLLDRNVVYASAQATGQGSGTRLDPAGNLAVALAKMRSEGRKILLMTSGTYPMTEAQDWTGFELWGGMKAGAWETTPTPARSTVVPMPGRKLTHLVEVYGTLGLHRIDFSDAGEPLVNLVQAQSSDITVEESAWQAKATGVLWRQVGGSLRLRSSSALWDGAKEGSLVSLDGVGFQAQDVRWTTQNATHVRALVLVRCESVVSGMTYLSRLGHGLETVLWSQGGDLTATDLKVSTGDGCSSSTAFVLDGTTSTFVNLEVNLYATQGNTGFQVTGGQLDLQKLRQTILKGSEFNVGLRLQNAVVRIQEGFLQTDTGSYQGGFTQNGGTLVMGATRVSMSGGGQSAWGLQTLGLCTVQLSNVSWILGKKTPGQPLLAQQQWASGSFNLDSRSTGW